MWPKRKPSSPANVRRSGRISCLRTSACRCPATSSHPVGRSEICDRAPEEHLAHHGRALQHSELVRLEQIEPRRQDGLHSPGHAQRVDLGERLQRRRPARPEAHPRRACAAFPRGRADCRRWHGSRQQPRQDRSCRPAARAAAAPRPARAERAGSSSPARRGDRRRGRCAPDRRSESVRRDSNRRGTRPGRGARARPTECRRRRRPPVARLRESPAGGEPPSTAHRSATEACFDRSPRGHVRRRRRHRAHPPGSRPGRARGPSRRAAST